MRFHRCVGCSCTECRTHACSDRIAASVHALLSSKLSCCCSFAFASFPLFLAVVVPPLRSVPSCIMTLPVHVWHSVRQRARAFAGLHDSLWSARALLRCRALVDDGCRDATLEDQVCREHVFLPDLCPCSSVPLMSSHPHASAPFSWCRTRAPFASGIFMHAWPSARVRR